MPMISILMPVFNGEAYVADAITSVLQDDFQDYELLVVDDGSTDKTAEILEQFRYDRRLRVLRKSNSGITDSLNCGLAHSLGEFIARLDADDINYRGRLARQIDYLRSHSECALVGSNFFVLNASGHQITRSKLGHMDHAHCVERLRNLWVPFMPHSSWLVRRKVLMELGGYDGFYNRCEDYDFCLRCSERYELACLPDHLVGIRKLQGSLSYDATFAQFRYSCVALLRHFGRVGVSPEVQRFTDPELLEIVNRWFAKHSMCQKLAGQQNLSFAKASLLSGSLFAAWCEFRMAVRSDPWIIRSRRELKAVGTMLSLEAKRLSHRYDQDSQVMNA